MLRELVAERPLLLLFGVASLGYGVGRLRVGGFSLGVAGVLFAGLLAGFLLPGSVVPESLTELGLALFVYTMGLASGPGFFASLRLRGLRDNALVVAVVLGSGALAFALARRSGLSGPTAAGLFSGALTNAPALAAVVESLRSAGAGAQALSEPVIACSLCYPLGVLLPLLVVAASPRWFHVDYARERVSRGYGGAGEAPIASATVRIELPPTVPASACRKSPSYSINFGRLRRGAVTSVVHDDTRFLPGDLVTVIGSEEDVRAAVRALGRPSDEHLEWDRSEVDFRRMFVSNADVTERPLRELDLDRGYGAVITRVRRGDVDLVPDASFELLLGDRVRVVAAKERMHALEQLFGDSARRLAEMDVITFGLGIALGLLLGAVQVPLPGGERFSLGLAGGPLVAGLVLGRLGRSGPLVWVPPYGVNLTLRQFGLVLFLAGIGLKAGSELAGNVPAEALRTLVVGGVISFVTTLVAIAVGHRLLRIPLGVMVGTAAGLQTQPAVLAYAIERTGKDLPNVGYVTVFPVAMIAKIVVAQLLLLAVR